MLNIAVFNMHVVLVLLTAFTLFNVLFHVLFHFFKCAVLLYKLQYFYDFRVFLCWIIVIISYTFVYFVICNQIFFFLD